MCRLLTSRPLFDRAQTVGFPSTEAPPPPSFPLGALLNLRHICQFLSSRLCCPCPPSEPEKCHHSFSTLLPPSCGHTMRRRRRRLHCSQLSVALFSLCGRGIFLFPPFLPCISVLPRFTTIHRPRPIPSCAQWAFLHLLFLQVAISRRAGGSFPSSTTRKSSLFGLVVVQVAAVKQKRDFFFGGIIEW
ncbi:hypothetical protein LX32DRAFT_309323 [Colletotrichum zoysiae]|uniref:Uncharacterized protein n=1 Tax=Colletotrichum zoysiae TaxID=1216348 RepID=A0AAD9HTI9_9PEZI|nr:hypothetical protein LX32DRAFT_309323 [Colletotrichum zoysiae]